MRRIALLILAAGALLQAGCLTVRPRIPLGDLIPGGSDGRWEYRQEIQCPDDDDSADAIAREQSEMLNHLGRDRWELVAVQVREGDEPRCWIFTLKRPLEGS
ncbi:MAG: hypothetical protein ACRD2J_00355 [Thermoanaerobaculia bacterium]